MTTRTAETLHLFIQESQGCGRVPQLIKTSSRYGTLFIFIHEEGD